VVFAGQHVQFSAGERRGETFAGVEVAVFHLAGVTERAAAMAGRVSASRPL